MQQDHLIECGEGPHFSAFDSTSVFTFATLQLVNFANKYFAIWQFSPFFVNYNVCNYSQGSITAHAQNHVLCRNLNFAHDNILQFSLSPQTLKI